VHKISVRAGQLTVSRRGVIGLAAGAIAATRASAAAVHELVMVEDEACIYCIRWHREVGEAYRRSPEGQFAPLRQVRIGAADIADLPGVRFTPTFILLEGRREVGRITGYPGADFFWGLLAELLAKTSFSSPPADDIKT
jgi:thioredoxin-related protein